MLPVNTGEPESNSYIISHHHKHLIIVFLLVVHDQIIWDSCQVHHFEHGDEKRKRQMSQKEFQKQKLDLSLIFLTLTFLLLLFFRLSEIIKWRFSFKINTLDQ